MKHALRKLGMNRDHCESRVSELCRAVACVECPVGLDCPGGFVFGTATADRSPMLLPGYMVQSGAGLLADRLYPCATYTGHPKPDARAIGDCPAGRSPFEEQSCAKTPQTFDSSYKMMSDELMHV